MLKRISYHIFMQQPALLFLLALLLFNGCRNYSFTGASIDPAARTVSVEYFPNVAPIVNPRLSQLLIEKLKNKFVVETQLRVIPADGDLQFSGKITSYVQAPVAIGNQTATLNRLTVTATVKFVNKLDEKKSFETSFSNFVDFDSQKNFSAIETQLVEEVSTMMVQDIFNKAVINW